MSWRKSGLKMRPDLGLGELRFGKDGRPLNPRGRTGLRGRGGLYLWGANVAVDPLLTRQDPNNRSKLLKRLIQKQKNGPRKTIGLEKMRQ